MIGKKKDGKSLLYACCAKIFNYSPGSPKVQLMHRHINHGSGRKSRPFFKKTISAL